MTEDLNVFPNAKSPLFGAGEDSIGIIQTAATAKLTGDASVAVSNTGSGFQNGNNDFSQSVNNKFGSFSNGSTVTSASVTVPSPNSVVVLMIANEQGNGVGSVKIRNNTTSTDIGSLALPADNSGITVHSTMVVDTSPSLGVSNSYSVIATSTSIIFQLDFRIQVITLDDTHDGAIDTVAIATKQINSPDSHTTREISVLPG